MSLDRILKELPAEVANHPSTGYLAGKLSITTSEIFEVVSYDIDPEDYVIARNNGEAHKTIIKLHAECISIEVANSFNGQDISFDMILLADEFELPCYYVREAHLAGATLEEIRSAIIEGATLERYTEARSYGMEHEDALWKYATDDLATLD